MLLYRSRFQTCRFDTVMLMKKLLAPLTPLKSHKSKTTIFKIHNSDGVSLFYKINADLAPR